MLASLGGYSSLTSLVRRCCSSIKLVFQFANLLFGNLTEVGQVSFAKVTDKSTNISTRTSYGCASVVVVVLKLELRLYIGEWTGLICR